MYEDCTIVQSWGDRTFAKRVTMWRMRWKTESKVSMAHSRFHKNIVLTENVVTVGGSETADGWEEGQKVVDIDRRAGVAFWSGRGRLSHFLCLFECYNKSHAFTKHQPWRFLLFITDTPSNKQNISDVQITSR